jgi:hypothetical protein
LARSKVTIDEKNNNELELKSTTTRKNSTSSKSVGTKKSTSVSKSKTKEVSSSSKNTVDKKLTEVAQKNIAKKSSKKAADEIVESSTTKKSKTTPKTTPKKSEAVSKDSNAKTSTKKTSDDAKTTATEKLSTVVKATAKKSSTVAKATATKKAGDDSKATVAKKSSAVAKATATKKISDDAKTTASKKSTKKTTGRVSLKSLISKKLPTRKKSKKINNTEDLSSSDLINDINAISDDENEKFVDIPEYYDLPYKYEKTVVKVLYQNPNTLFVYWDISDDDINGFKKAYGDNFFYVTKPVLVIHNISDGYSFEIEVNDFANNWYIHVSDAKCKYNVELGRRPSQSAKIENLAEHRMDDFINVSYSNTIEMPNDHILFFKNNDKIYFKNIKTNKVTEKIINLKSDSKNIKSIYDKYNLSDREDRFDFNNPSSQNPTSNVM